MKRIASIQDISCLGRCSLTVALPVISAMGVECAIVPTAVLSAHTAFPGFVSRDLTDQLPAIAAHWRQQRVHFDALYTGYIASVPQVQQVLDFFDAVKSPGTLLIVDPAMADHGKLYAGFGDDFPAAMARVVARADVALPNITEACLLTGTPYREDVDEGFAIEDLLALMGLDEDVRNSLASQTQEKIQDTGVSLVMAVVESLAQSILYAALFLVSFVGLTILLKLLIRAMDLVLQLPGLHLVNALGGAVIGLIEGALVLFLAIWVLRRFGVSFETDTVSATHILRFFATHTPLSALSLLQ